MLMSPVGWSSGLLGPLWPVMVPRTLRASAGPDCRRTGQGAHEGRSVFLTTGQGSGGWPGALLRPANQGCRLSP